MSNRIERYDKYELRKKPLRPGESSSFSPTAPLVALLQAGDLGRPAIAPFQVLHDHSEIESELSLRSSRPSLPVGDRGSGGAPPERIARIHGAAAEPRSR